MVTILHRPSMARYRKDPVLKGSSHLSIGGIHRPPPGLAVDRRKETSDSTMSHRMDSVGLFYFWSGHSALGTIQLWYSSVFSGRVNRVPQVGETRHPAWIQLTDRLCFISIRGGGNKGGRDRLHPGGPYGEAPPCGEFHQEDPPDPRLGRTSIAGWELDADDKDDSGRVIGRQSVFWLIGRGVFHHL
ncbi:hypothetical protein NPIL_269441 [Nephila pilipes]|uniref:Uncharacterized protein n=1 Tax=Nephila pilipes TaxID=299642 RepID=A0A8X6UIZ9_NEPPI|nr:hypothetical protein NPIL_269441 [Nephila pilipes]